MTRSVPAAGAVAFLSISLLLAACNSSTPSASPAASEAAASAGAATPTAAASVAASPSPGAEASAAPSSGAPSPFDVSQIIAGLSNLDSYRQTITVGGEQAFDVVVVTKPTLARAMTITGGAKVVIIGDKGWLSNDDGKTYQSIPPAMIEPLSAAFTPELLIGPFGGAGFVQGASDLGTEQKNGVDARHYHIDADSPGASLTSFPPDASIDVWVANEGYVVAVETKGFAGSQDVQLQVTKVNDPANKVEEPG